MRRMLVVTAVCAFVLAVPHAAYAQGPPDTHGGPLPGNPAADSPVPVLSTGSAPRGVVTAVDVLARFATVQGTLRTYSGALVAGADVDWGTTNGGVDTYGGSTTTDGAGAYSFTSVTPSANGYLAFWFKSGDDWRSLWQYGLNFADASTLTFDTRPGRVNWTAYRGGPWDFWQWPTVVVEDTGSNGAWTDYSVDDSGTESGAAEAMPGTVDYGCFYFWWDEADEYFPASPFAVTAGATPGSGLTFDEDEALRSAVKAPFWYSCKPGEVVTLSLRNWPGGHQAAFWGYPDAPSGPSTTFGGQTWTSAGTTATKKLRIPARAKPGYGYIVGTIRTDNTTSDLMLREYIQLATLKKSAASGGVRLSGVVPTKGHWGSKRGIRKTVVIYARTRYSKTPKRWDPRGLGWKRVASVRCNGYGAYRTGILRPTRSTWYVARYARDSWYWGAFTNVVSVKR